MAILKGAESAADPEEWSLEDTRACIRDIESRIGELEVRLTQQHNHNPFLEPLLAFIRQEERELNLVVRALDSLCDPEEPAEEPDDPEDPEDPEEDPSVVSLEDLSKMFKFIFN